MVDKVAKLPKKWELLWKPAERRNKRKITLKKAKKKNQKPKPTVSASPPKCTCPGILFCNVDKIFYVKKVFILFSSLFALPSSTSDLLLKTLAFYEEVSMPICLMSLAFIAVYLCTVALFIS